ELSRKFVDAWRHEVSGMWPNVLNDERLRARIVTALVGWSLLSLAILEAGGLTALIDKVRFTTDSGEDNASAGRAVGTKDSEDSDLDRSIDFRGQHILHGRARTRDQLVIRRDIIQTFEALGALAERGQDPRFPAVAAFSREVCTAVRNLERSGS
ncbi:MAG: hypothetical protein E6534_07480, partial [Corynebacterium kroppenstedtii]|nr:hypothetical protein [Corynebacterium kroppenstedtii]